MGETIVERRARAQDKFVLYRALRASGLLVARLWFRTPLHRWQLSGRHPLKLSSRIEAPWPGDAARGDDILGGTFSHVGHSYNAEGGSPWTPDVAGARPPAELAPWLHSFGWLADLAASGENNGDQQTARHLAERIAGDWLAQYSNWSPLAWRVDIIGARLLSWIAHSDLVLSSGDMVYRSAALNVMARQARHLRANLDLAPEGPARVRAACGMMTAMLLLPGILRGGGKSVTRSLRQLESALHAAINTDGGPITRNADDAVGMIRDLVTLKSAFRAVDQVPPDWLQMTLDKMIPFVRALSHGDHLRAQFNGAYGGEMPNDPTLAEKSEAYGRAPIRVPITGYDRLKRWRTCVIVDTAPPPPTSLSHAHHAAPLALEFSDAADRIIVNMGGSPGELSLAAGNLTRNTAANPTKIPDSLAALSRTTAAHSTLIVGNTNACTLKSDGRIGRGPSVVEVERRENEDGQWLSASHDGYLRRWGLIHQREIFINAAGTDVRGKDTLTQVKRPSFFGPKSAAGEPVHVRFHLAPGLAASPTREGGAIIMRLPHGHGWLFRGEGSQASEGSSIEIEDSLYLTHPEEAKKTRQIVMTSVFGGLETHVRWSFRRLDSKD